MFIIELKKTHSNILIYDAESFNKRCVTKIQNVKQWFLATVKQS